MPLFRNNKENKFVIDSYMISSKVDENAPLLKRQALSFEKSATTPVNTRDRSHFLCVKRWQKIYYK